MGMKKLCIALVAIALGAVTVAPASAAQEGNQIVQIENVGFGQCLQPSTPEPHAQIAFGDCGGAVDQRWELIPVGGGKHLLRNLASNECVSDRYGHYYCDDEEVTAQAELVTAADGTTRFKFGDEYLEGFAYQDGRRDVWITRFADTAVQRWRVRQIGTTTPVDTTGKVVRIRTVNDGYGCISLKNGSRIMPKPCANSEEEKFQRIELANGSTALRSTVNGKCVAAKEGSTLDLEVVADCTPDDSRQHLTIEQTKTGAARIRYTADQRYFTPAYEVVLYPRQRDINTWQLWELLPA
jgi:Cytolethal distending toxin A/C domain